MKVVITIKEKYIPILPKIANMFLNDGLKITNIYEFGVIIGLIEADSIKSIKKHIEVLSLTEEKEATIE